MYELDLTLKHGVDEKRSRLVKSGRNPRFELAKQDTKVYWNVLPKDKRLYKKFCKADFDRWMDEDDWEEAVEEAAKKKASDASGDLENGEQVASLAEYQANLRRIFAHLKKTAPQAKLIFALTTKVPSDSNGRFENAELAYNVAALAVLKEFPDIAVNDLRTASLPYEQPGNVHFKAAGLSAQAKHVAQVIASHLSK